MSHSCQKLVAIVSVPRNICSQLLHLISSCSFAIPLVLLTLFSSQYLLPFPNVTWQQCDLLAPIFERYALKLKIQLIHLKREINCENYNEQYSLKVLNITDFKLRDFVISEENRSLVLTKILKSHNKIS